MEGRIRKLRPLREDEEAHTFNIKPCSPCHDHDLWREGYSAGDPESPRMQPAHRPAVVVDAAAAAAAAAVVPELPTSSIYITKMACAR